MRLDAGSSPAGRTMITSKEDLDLSKVHELLPDSCILAGFRGSISHGTYREDIGDIDILSIHVGPPEHYIGFGRKGQETIDFFEGEYDVVSHEVRKFCSLLAKGNPNVVSLLWLPDHMILKNTWWGQELRFKRALFASKRFYHSFKGYARSRREHFSESLSEVSSRYDNKPASETVRLLDQGIEFLRNGSLTFPRPNAEQLLRIRKGEVTIDSILGLIETLEDRLEEAHEQTKLPEEANREEIEKMLMRLIQDRIDSYE